MADEYPRDEFDQIAESAGPVGVHRAPRPWWILVVTPIVVFVIAGLLAFLVAQILWDSGRDGANPSTPSIPDHRGEDQADGCVEQVEQHARTLASRPSRTRERRPRAKRWDHGSMTIAAGTA